MLDEQDAPHALRGEPADIPSGERSLAKPHLAAADATARPSQSNVAQHLETLYTAGAVKLLNWKCYILYP